MKMVTSWIDVFFDDGTSLRAVDNKDELNHIAQAVSLKLNCIYITSISGAQVGVVPSKILTWCRSTRETRELNRKICKMLEEEEKEDLDVKPWEDL